jgi:hypothetical protein
MNVFDSLTIYAGKWQVKETRKFNEVEIAAVASAVVVDSEYGKSVCFFLNAGGQTYIPLSTNSSKNIGDTIDVSQASLLTLSKKGEADIQRVEI